MVRSAREPNPDRRRRRIGQAVRHHAIAISGEVMARTRPRGLRRPLESGLEGHLFVVELGRHNQDLESQCRRESSDLANAFVHILGIVQSAQPEHTQQCELR